ncbi:aromatic amino acid lyase [Actinoplanes subtropicus]|uniref:aromatic amino acid lyase n=1 Tax=Actinoplanes subtropicus TaxID=543632 RepID=UPI000AFF9C19|nr:aromatic amino acid lyase [Actinoplanes subtropicus]
MIRRPSDLPATIIRRPSDLSAAVIAAAADAERPAAIEATTGAVQPATVEATAVAAPPATVEATAVAEQPPVITVAARAARPIILAPELLDALAASRRDALRDLGGDRPVYGVNTGMGAMAGVRLDPAAQARQQNTLMIGRSVGSAPWLSRREARAVLAARLRTLLHPAAGVSPELCQFLVALLDAGVVPAIPRRGGAAGEIIPLAHAGAALIGAGMVLSPAGEAVDAAPALAAAGLTPRPFEAKEGVAFLEGVPGLTGLAVLAAGDTRTLLDQVLVAAAAAHAVIGASDDPLHPALADSDELDAVLTAMRGLLPRALPEGGTAAHGPLGDATDPRGLPEGGTAAHGPLGDGTAAHGLPEGGSARRLQAPVSFRVTAPALAVALRAVAGLEAATERALAGVTDSPAHLDGRFVGTFGFAGTELAHQAGALTTALVHLAELGAARLHRLLDAEITGLPRQLSDAPGLHAGMVTVHKRAVGVVHRLRRFATPALAGAVETSLGQEDVQSFGFEAAECLAEAITGLRDVVACELLAIHQARLLGAPVGDAFGPALDEIAAVLPEGTADRPFGRDLDQIITRLAGGWSSRGR